MRPALILILLLSTVLAHADNTEDSRTSLIALTTFRLIVAVPEGDTTPPALAEAIGRDAELRLAKNGIRTVTYDELVDIPGQPTLRINVETLSLDTDPFFRVEVTVWQTVQLKSNAITCYARTWSSHALFLGGHPDDAHNRAVSKASATLSVFLDAWHSVNPKP